MVLLVPVHILSPRLDGIQKSQPAILCPVGIREASDFLQPFLFLKLVQVKNTEIPRIDFVLIYFLFVVENTQGCNGSAYREIRHNRALGGCEIQKCAK